MKTEPGHYSAHCIPDLMESLKIITKFKLHPDAENLALFIGKLKTSVKFIMPPDGTFTDEIGAALPDQLALPFDVVALEYHIGAKAAPVEGMEARSSRRIVIATQTAENEIFVESASYFDEDKRWEILPWFAKVSMGPVEDAEAIIREAKSRERQPHYVTKPNPSGLYPLIITGALMPMAVEIRRNSHETLRALTREEIRATIYKDLGQEVCVALNFIESVMCANVSVEKIPPSRTKNAMRVRKGQIPFDTYHVLTIGAGRERVRLAGEMGGGTHASPRLHVRRGHFRRLPSGRTTLVHAHYVGSPDGGRVSKDYKVEGPTRTVQGQSQ